MSCRWPERFRRRRDLRPMGTARLAACLDEGDHPAILLWSEERDALERVRRAHQAISAPHVARVIDADPAASWIAFACDADSDLEALVAATVDASIQAPYPAAIAFNEIMMDTIEAAHTAPGGPYCLGELAWSNVLVSPTGHCWLFGLGHNFVLRAEGLLRNVAGLCQAPEVLLGVNPSPASDVYVVHAMLRSLLPYVTLLDVLVGAVGESLPELSSVRQALIALDNDAQATDPAHRIESIAALRARYRDIRRLVADMPDPDEPALRELFADLVRRSEPTLGRYLRVEVQARRVELAGGRAIDLSRRHVLWRALLCLVEAGRETPGQPVESDRLLQAGWPDEKVLAEAARARIYVTISQLRKLGLREVILQRDAGYLISPEVEVRILDGR